MAQKQKVVKGKVYNWDDKSKLWLYQYTNPYVKDGVYDQGGIPKAGKKEGFFEQIMSPEDVELAQTIGRHLEMKDMPSNAGAWMRGVEPERTSYPTPERLRPVSESENEFTSTTAPVPTPASAPSKPVDVVEPAKPTATSIKLIPPIATISQKDWEGVDKIVQDKIKEVSDSARHPWEPKTGVLNIIPKIPSAPVGATIPRFKSKAQINADLDTDIDEMAKQKMREEYAPKKPEVLEPRPALISTPASMKQTEVAPSDYAKELRSRYAQALAGQYGSTSSTSSTGSLM